MTSRKRRDLREVASLVSTWEKEHSKPLFDKEESISLGHLNYIPDVGVVSS